jgi:hypothetical protein
MADRFFNYLEQERERLDQEMERAVAIGASDQIAAINQLRKIVDDQLARWSGDLADVLAA